MISLKVVLLQFLISLGVFLIGYHWGKRTGRREYRRWIKELEAISRGENPEYVE